MENLFDLLIILFIIYAFLAPLLKKKPPVAKKPEPQTYDDEFQTKEEKSSQEILREIEELFGYKSEEPEISIPQEDEEFLPSKTEKSKTEDFVFQAKTLETTLDEEQSFQRESVTLHPDLQPYDYEGTIPEIEIDEFDYSQLDVYDYSKSEEEKTYEEEVRTFEIALGNIDDIKKAIVYKEIFDTPLALRMRKIKWQRSIY